MAAILKSQFNLDVIMMTDGAYTAKLKSQFNLARSICERKDYEIH